ncbi:hypothetical protein D3C80_689790 [compost metagenome]
MGGWTRLWLIGCVVMLIPVFMAALDYWPSSETDRLVHEANVKSNELELSIIKAAMEYPESSPGVIDDTHNIEQITQKINQEERRYQETVDSRWSRQVACVLLFSAIWFAVCALLYVLGLIGGWVMKGFHKNET